MSEIQASAIQTSAIQSESTDVKVDSEEVYLESDERKKEIITIVVSANRHLQIEESHGSFIVRQKSGSYWYVITEVEGEPSTFDISIYANSTFVARKYLKRQLEQFVYEICELINLDEYRQK
jgi:hypothetical protein